MALAIDAKGLSHVFRKPQTFITWRQKMDEQNQNSNENRSLEEQVTELIILARQSLTAKKRIKPLDVVTGVMSSLKTIISTFIIIVVAILLAWFLVLEVKRTAVEITGFDVPPEFEKEGFSSNVVASRLADR